MYNYAIATCPKENAQQFRSIDIDRAKHSVVGSLRRKRPSTHETKDTNELCIGTWIRFISIYSLSDLFGMKILSSSYSRSDEDRESPQLQLTRVCFWAYESFALKVSWSDENKKKRMKREKKQTVTCVHYTLWWSTAICALVSHMTNTPRDSAHTGHHNTPSRPTEKQICLVWMLQFGFGGYNDERSEWRTLIVWPKRFRLNHNTLTSDHHPHHQHHQERKETHATGTSFMLCVLFLNRHYAYICRLVKRHENWDREKGNGKVS